MNAPDGSAAAARPVGPLHKAALLALVMAIYLVRLGAGSLWDNSEPTYGEIVKELFLFHDWLTLHLDFQIWTIHPPLWFWLAGASAWAFGLNEFSLRLPSALFGVATAIATYRAGRRLYGDAAGLAAGLCVATSLEVIVLARLATMETQLIFFMTVAFLWSYFAVRDADRRSFWIAVVAAALGTLTKGPVAAVLPALVLLAWCAWTKAWARLAALPWTAGAAVYLVIAGAWFAAETARLGVGFLGAYFGLSNIGRFVQPFENQPGPFWYYVPVLILGFFPWVAFLPQAVLRALRAGTGDDRFLILMFALPFIFFSAAQTKLPNYIAVAFAALAILVGKLFADAVAANALRPLRWSLVFLPLALLVLSATVVVYGRLHFVGELAVLAPSLAALGWFVVPAAVLTAALALALRRPSVAPAGLALMMAGFVGGLVVFVLPRVEALKPMKAMAADVMARWQPGDRICFAGVSGGFSLLYYTNGGPVSSVGTESTEVPPKEYFDRETRALCVVSPSRYESLRSRGFAFDVLERRPKMLLVENQR